MLFLVLIYRYFFPLLSYINKGLNCIAYKKAPPLSGAHYTLQVLCCSGFNSSPNKPIGIPGFNMILECLGCFRAIIPFAKKQQPWPFGHGCSVLFDLGFLYVYEDPPIISAVFFCYFNIHAFCRFLRDIAPGFPV